MSWQDQWEDAAATERAAYEAMAPDALLERVRDGRLGNYSQIWEVVAGRATLAQAGWVLFDVLERDIDYLHRMPCAEALLNLMECEEFTPADLGGTHQEVSGNLCDLKKMLRERIGPPHDNL